MRVAVFKYGVLTTLVFLIGTIIVLLPFHALITVWLASHFGHYVAFRLWKEALLLICGLCTVFLLATDHKIRFHTLTRRLTWLIVIYALWVIIRGLKAHYTHKVTNEALGYGLVVDLRYLLFFLITWAVAVRTNRLMANWYRWLIVPAVIVVTFGVLQFLVLPHDFLRHFGYGPNTILPYETIDHKNAYFRVQSTLRGANPLGAYLVVVLSVLAAYWAMSKKWRPQRSVLGLGVFVALAATYSRSAWIGALLSLAVVGWVAIKSAKIRRYALVGAALFAVVLAGLIVGFRHNDRLQNTFFHTDEHSHSATSSNADHISALKNGLKDMESDPFGRGPGTAGPASFYNNGQGRIAENYYIQIGQETGIIGLAIYILINGGVVYLLWVRRSHPLALGLLAAWVGISFINLLSHAWTDDTLSYIWWGLAGIAITINPYAHAKVGSKAEG